MIQIPADARVLLCDVWGVVHNGHRAFPGALAALARWRGEGRVVVLVTNAPRPTATIVRQLDALGVPADCYDAVASSGDTGVAIALARGGRAGFIGTAHDRRSLDGSGLTLGVEDAPIVVCTGFEEHRPALADYAAELAAMAARGATLLCFNPDLYALHGEVMEPCAGLIAERYAAMGGDVVQAGKPYPAIYARALALAGAAAGRTIDRDEVLAIGDAVATDMVGAARGGFRLLFVTAGIERDVIAADGVDALLARARAEHGLADFAPIAVVDGLA